MLPRLFVGPMSKEIVDIAIDYSNKKKTLGLIPSRRQVEYDGGYVNDWKTADFTSYVRKNSNNILLVRDHGGPSQGSLNDDGLKSLKTDIDSGFDILHIDPWKTCKTIEDGIKKTANLIQHSIMKNPNLTFEVGTEESIFPYSPADLDKLLIGLQTKLGDKFNLIKFVVIQSGVEIAGTENIGNYNPDRLEKMVTVAKKYSLYSKEHNGDYLSFDQIQHRANLGLDSINIAPEFGVTQTRALLERNMVKFQDALKTCVKIGKFNKWIPNNLKINPPEHLIVEVSGHYCFMDQPFKNVSHLIKDELSAILFERFDEICGAWK